MKLQTLQVFQIVHGFSSLVRSLEHGWAVGSPTLGSCQDSSNTNRCRSSRSQAINWVSRITSSSRETDQGVARHEKTLSETLVLAKSSIFEFPAAIYASKKNLLIWKEKSTPPQIIQKNSQERNSNPYFSGTAVVKAKLIKSCKNLYFLRYRPWPIFMIGWFDSLKFKIFTLFQNCYSSVFRSKSIKTHGFFQKVENFENFDHLASSRH